MKLQKMLLILSASAMLGAAITAADVALAQPMPGPPPGGPPPGWGTSSWRRWRTSSRYARRRFCGHGSPPGVALSRPPGVGGPAGFARPGGSSGPRAAGLPRPSGAGGARAGFRAATAALTVAPGPMRTAIATTMATALRLCYGYGSCRHRYGPDGVYVYNNSTESSGCYYTYKYSSRLHAYTRVWTCSEQ